MTERYSIVFTGGHPRIRKGSGRFFAFASRLPVVLLLCALTFAGCASYEHYFRLEEWGEGWTLKVEEKDGRTFQASWVDGDNRTLKLVNYHEADKGGYTVVNTLYLEVDGNGGVKRGMLKRFAVPELSQEAYAEQGAKWFRVLEGWCRIDVEGSGSLELRTEGAFEFKGNVEPADGLEIKRPE